MRELLAAPELGRRAGRRAGGVVRVLAANCLLLCTAIPAAGAEVRLRAECSVASPIVRLGDVADIVSADSEEAAALAQLELFAAPPPGRPRHLTARDIHEVLALSGHDLRKVRLSGAASIAVSTAPPSADSRQQAPPSDSSPRRGQELIEQALRRALAAQFGLHGWELTWDQQAAAAVAAARPGASVQILTMTPLDAGEGGDAETALTAGEVPPAVAAADGSAPSRQEADAVSAARTARRPTSVPEYSHSPIDFSVRLRISIGETASTHDLLLRATPPSTVVVARRTLAPGTLITPADVELSHAPSRIPHPRASPAAAELSAVSHSSDRSQSLSRTTLGSSPRGTAGAQVLGWEECLGKETTRTIAAGQVLTADALREPLLVKRGEAVTVYARSYGVVVRLTGRALDSGSRGSLVSVESLENRQRFLARVSGMQQVVVDAEPQVGEVDAAVPSAASATTTSEQLGSQTSGTSPEPSRAGVAGPSRSPRSYRVRLSSDKEPRS